MAEKNSRPRIAIDPGDRIGANGKKGKKGGIHWLVHFFLLLVLFLGAIGAGVWYLVKGNSSSPTQRQAINVPLIKADADPYKVRPIDPGGMAVPGRDRLVYGRLEQSGANKTVESLLPPPEEPLPPPDPGQKVIAEFGKKPGPQPQSESEPVLPPPTPDVTAKAVPQPVPGAAIRPTEEKSIEAVAKVAIEELAKKPLPKAVPAPPPEVAPAPRPQATPTVLSGGYQVQMASLRDEKSVEREWARLKKAHPDLLGTLDLAIERADLGAKGVYYRLRAGRLADRLAAETLCRALKTRKVACIPVKGDN